MRELDTKHLSPEQFTVLASAQVPLAGMLGFRIEQMHDGLAIGRAPYRPEFIRPGGTVSGPVLMALADFTMWAAVFTRIGADRVAEMAVTTHLGMNFLRRPAPVEVVAEARLFKLGRRLATGEVRLFSAGNEDMVAHCTCTYAIPPRGLAIDV